MKDEKEVAADTDTKHSVGEVSDFVKFFSELWQENNGNTAEDAFGEAGTAEPAGDISGSVPFSPENSYENQYTYGEADIEDNISDVGSNHDREVGEHLYAEADIEESGGNISVSGRIFSACTFL